MTFLIKRQIKQNTGLMFCQQLAKEFIDKERRKQILEEIENECNEKPNDQAAPKQKDLDCKCLKEHQEEDDEEGHKWQSRGTNESSPLIRNQENHVFIDMKIGSEEESGERSRTRSNPLILTQRNNENNINVDKNETKIC